MPNYYHVLPAWQLASQEELAAVIETLHAQRSVCKLHIGAANNRLSDWLNTDIYPSEAYIYYLDAQRPFPIGDKRVQYIFSEHMIEHISLKSGDDMLGECYRVLADGGKIRLATPDLANILSIYFSTNGDAIEYKSWAQRFNHFENDQSLECRLVNNFMHAWGHKFVYDERTLILLLQRNGFVDIKRYPIGVSEDPNFCSIERHGEMIGTASNEFETMVIEAQKAP
jgi:predicted SAM-dependent methyltransferase